MPAKHKRAFAPNQQHRRKVTKRLGKTAITKLRFQLFFLHHLPHQPLLSDSFKPHPSWLLCCWLNYKSKERWQRNASNHGIYGTSPIVDYLGRSHGDPNGHNSYCANVIATTEEGFTDKKNSEGQEVRVVFVWKLVDCFFIFDLEESVWLRTK